jgi:predicted RNA binding protein YcfA (HicA-like mRNA interferase family)
MRPKRLLNRLQAGSFNNVSFTDFVQLLEALGFQLREHRGGSHSMYKHPAIGEKMNVQPLRNGDAKPYQIRQLVRLIERYDLSLEDRDA